ncbi:hypothetical protein C8D92_10411 [Tamilnaduibacter salinus]|uniref:Uncharacterized protein n=1 Tax=Tamilnaduibacter salinus TaxID=1484056 RepID=A0A2A2I0J8_9GAMM|nr:hypothetical protein [Tamilnaduibacter salinus]PAV25132.1 hypothetical protein CF392_12610 [Tamilnaduibacter salinus]PVY76780.1 hypothetical protein C8D92_10411 [Tamilnaduibacter salinus]
MKQQIAIDELVSVAQGEAMGELDAPMMAIVLSPEQSYDLPIQSLETDADKARWALILRAAREHVSADAVAVLYPAWTTIKTRQETGQEPDDDTIDPIDTLFVQLHTRDRIYWRGFEQIRDPRHQRIVGFRRIGALSTDYDRGDAPSVAAWLNTLFEPLPEDGEETEVDRELADLLEEPEVSAALYPREMRSLH